MNLGTIIIGAIAVAICFLPFFLMNSGKKKRDRQLIQSLNDFAAKSNCSISKTDIWYNAAIGLDEKNKVLFFLKKENDKESIKEIKLSEIQNAKILKNSKPYGKKNNESILIEHIGLALSSGDKNKPDIVLTFYSSISNRQIHTEFQLAEKWEKNVNICLQSKNREGQVMSAFM